MSLSVFDYDVRTILFLDLVCERGSVNGQPFLCMDTTYISTLLTDGFGLDLHHQLLVSSLISLITLYKCRNSGLGKEIYEPQCPKIQNYSHHCSSHQNYSHHCGLPCRIIVYSHSYFQGWRQRWLGGYRPNVGER